MAAPRHVALRPTSSEPYEPPVCHSILGLSRWHMEALGCASPQSRRRRQWSRDGASHTCFAISHAVPCVELREALHLGPRLLQPMCAAKYQPTALPPSLLVLLHLSGVALLVR